MINKSNIQPTFHLKFISATFRLYILFVIYVITYTMETQLDMRLYFLSKHYLIYL